jgi:hypothetical protein
LGNLFERASDVNGSGTQAITGGPWNRRIQCVVDLESTSPIAESLQLILIIRGQVGTGDVKKLSGSNVCKDEV